MLHGFKTFFPFIIYKANSKMEKAINSIIQEIKLMQPIQSTSTLFSQ